MAFHVVFVHSCPNIQWRSNAVARAGKVQGNPEFHAKIKKNNFPVTVKITTSGYQTLECFIATLPTGRLVRVGETCNRFADSGL